jgi:DNA polymerase/3'-5' exonuclease PolX
MTDYKNKIISELEVLRRISVTEDAGIFKGRVYTAAIRTLSALPHVRSMGDLPLVQKGDGLGKEVRIKIQKILETGSLDISQQARDLAVSLETLQNIYGVGPKKAQDLIAAGYTTIASLRANPKLLNKNQQIGLRYYEDLLKRIPRSEMDKHAALLMEVSPAEGMIVGSYRRGKPDSGDIDMLIRSTDSSSDHLAKFVAILKAKGYIREILALGEHKCMAICAITVARRLDILVTPADEYPFAVFYFTGSDTFNVAVRSHALTRGYTLNEHGIVHIKTGCSVKGVKTEKDLFSLLKLQWVEPVNRTGPEAVCPVTLDGALPKA